MGSGLGAGLGVAAGLQQALGSTGTARACAGRADGRGVRSRQALGTRGARVLGAGRARPGRWARGLARAVHSVHSAWFSTRFFDSVFFLNH